MCIFNVFPVGGVLVVAVGYTRACIHLWTVWSGHTCAIPNPLTSWHERRARAHACPYCTHIGLRPTRTQKMQLQKKSGDKHIYIYIYIYIGSVCMPDACITSGKHACTSADLFRIYNQTPANLGPSNASNASNELEYCPFPW